MITVYNRVKETHAGDNNYPVYFGSGILSNPYTDLKERRNSVYYVKNIDDALVRYSAYFDLMYRCNEEFKVIIDEIYEKYKSGIDVYLEDSDFVDNCTGNIIKKKLERKFIIEKIKKYKDLI